MSHSPAAFELSSPLLTGVRGDMVDELENSTTTSMRSSTRRRRGFNENRERNPPSEWERTLHDLERMQRENKERLHGSSSFLRGSFSIGTPSAAAAGPSNPSSPLNDSIRVHDMSASVDRMSASAMRRRRGHLSGTYPEHHVEQQRRFDALFAECRQVSPSPLPIAREAEGPATTATTASQAVASIAFPEEDDEPPPARPIQRMPLDWPDVAAVESDPPPPAKAHPAGSGHLPTRRTANGFTTSGPSFPSPTAPAPEPTPAAFLQAASPPAPSADPSPPLAADPPPNAATTSAEEPQVTEPLVQASTAPRLSLESSDSPPAADARGSTGSTPLPLMAAAPHQPEPAPRSPEKELASSRGSTLEPQAAPSPVAEMPRRKSDTSHSPKRAAALPTRALTKGASSPSHAKATAQPTAPACAAKGLPTRLARTASSGWGATAGHLDAAEAARESRHPSLTAAAATPAGERRAKAERRDPAEGTAAPPSSHTLRTARGGGHVPMTNALTERRRLEAIQERRERERQAAEEAALRAPRDRPSHDASLLLSARKRRGTVASVASAIPCAATRERLQHRPTAPSTPLRAPASAVAEPQPPPHMTSLVNPSRPKKAEPAAAAAVSSSSPAAVTAPETARTTTASVAETPPSSTRRTSVGPTKAPPAAHTRRSAGARHADPTAAEPPRPRRSTDRPLSVRSGKALPTATPAPVATAAAAGDGVAGRGTPHTSHTPRTPRTPLPQGLETKRAAGGEEPQPPVPTPVPFCIECGRRHIDDRAKFCAFCGHKREFV